METPYLMTHSLLSSWQYALRVNPREDASTKDTSIPDFLRTLRREPTPTTEAMQMGIDFENLVTGIFTGAKTARYDKKNKSTGQLEEEWYPIAEHPWYEAALQIAHVLEDAQFQYKAKKRIAVGGTDLLLYGRLDALKAGTVYDIKFSSKYERGKFFNSTQHPVYLEIVPEADRFVYLISNGTDVWTEEYLREETGDIRPVIEEFLNWLNVQGLMETYRQHWAALPRS